jgi:hypothetical protein
MEETPPPVVLVPAFGVDGAATFVLSLEPGTKLTYSWLTEVLSMYDGTEQRISWQESPAIRVEGPAFLLDVGDRAARAALMRSAASGATFLLALPMEAVQTVGDADGTTLTVVSTAMLDWLQAGQRAVLVGADGVSGAVVVQSSTATTITIDAVPDDVNATGSALMPVIPIVLDAQQGFTRYPVTVDLWDLRAKAIAYGWCGLDVMGVGASVLTFDAGLIDASELTDESLIIWDRTNVIDGTGAETMASGAEVVDLGGLPFALGGADVVDWLRPIKLRSSDTADQQWLKAVSRHLHGAQVAFLLPTGRADLVFESIPGLAQLMVSGDYASWFPSLAHRRLAVTTTDEIVQYVAVTGVVDNGDGTNTLSLSDNLFGPIARVSFLELVRLESDIVAPEWDGGVMTCDLVAHVAQDTTTTEDILTSAFAGHGLDEDFDFPVGVTSMTRDMHWETGRFASGAILETNGFVPHFRTACVGPAAGTATIRRNGANASGATGGAGYAVGAGTLNGGSGTGKTATTGAGAEATAFGFWPTERHPGFGGAGGRGTPANIGGPSGGGPLTLEPDTSGSFDVIAAVRMRLMTASTTAISGGAGGSSGGGSGVAAGGGGGAGAGNVVVCAGRFVYPENIVVQAIGGNGGNGVALNCGGGGGGGGGDICVITGRLPFPDTIDNSGGTGGIAGGGTASDGNVGVDGASPFLFVG